MPERAEGVPYVSAVLADATRRAALLVELEDLARSLPREELPAFLGDLERVRVSVLVAATPPTSEAAPASQKTSDRLLTVAETASRLARSRSWVYKNKRALPMVPLPTGGYGFSEKKLERWIEQRSAD
jgi:predicted DNA-binding transcriptional regulator AlpA